MGQDGLDLHLLKKVIFVRLLKNAPACYAATSLPVLDTGKDEGVTL
jgi:hypothetical protein